MKPELERGMISPFRNETSPVAVPGMTVTCTLTDVPCVIVVGLSVSVVALGVKVAVDQFLMRLATFTEPSPVGQIVSGFTTLVLSGGCSETQFSWDGVVAHCDVIECASVCGQSRPGTVGIFLPAAMSAAAKRYST